ncbi:hypothetical protein PG985_011303 [Apiospora marii]|uniref:Uncharacterized protein n=1 Tax=Apiospora marii TaxID=335849 RepID=A0ABR1ST99_9PEZI
MPTILDDESWEFLCDWMENQPAKGNLKVSKDSPYLVGQIQLWVRDKPQDGIFTATSKFPAQPVASPTAVPPTSPSAGTENAPPLGSSDESTGEELFLLGSAHRTSSDSPRHSSPAGSPGHSPPTGSPRHGSPGGLPQVHAFAGPQAAPRASSGHSFRRQFDRLTDTHMALLSQDKDERLWPEPDWLHGNWPIQTTWGITVLLSRALGYLAGCGSISDRRLSTYAWNTKLPFKVPVKVELNDASWGDAIMRGLHSPSANAQGAMYHWSAGHYIVHNPDKEMGAIIEIPDGVHTPRSIDYCELHALCILLARQKTYGYAKPKLSAWVISIKPDHFRVLEAYLDQNVDPHAFHFSIVDECRWMKRKTRNLDGSDVEYKWLLSWALAQLRY